MARDRKKRRHRAEDDDQGEPEATPEGEGAPEVEAALDRSCLVHPGFNLEQRCDRCGAALCVMCAVHLHQEGLCGDCLAAHAARARQGGAWRGLLALGLGLLALAVVTAPLAFQVDREAAAGFLGGRAALIYGPMLMSCAGVIVGLSAQDFSGLARRAGLAGAALSSLALAFVLLLNLARAL